MKFFRNCSPAFLLLFSIAMGNACSASPVIIAKNVDTSRCGTNIPNPTGSINDFANVFTNEEKAALDSICKTYSKKGYGQVAVVTMDSIPLERCNILDYAIDIGNKWGVGNKGKYDGTVILVSFWQKQVAIANGYGTQRILPDQQTKAIVDSVFIPSLKKGNHFEACYNGILAIEQFMSRAH